MNRTECNYAYIDGQNLHLGTTKGEPVWYIDLARFRVYLKEKYKVEKAYYYLGYVQEGEQAEELYEDIQSAGFILVFRQHSKAMISNKKGNVDSDIIFNIMKRLYLKEKFDKIVLVSGDGDYKMLVDFLIEQNKFKKILFPSARASSLYKSIRTVFYDCLSNRDVKSKIEKRKRVRR
ncbi:MAG TPA: NYN domain-containing protein [Candidatus Saccharibacteria bacterium]|jgi:uncharacterized LabA/DUF88 family protein|nr:NYN domain-containing protein [Candidatus Saccharibacteria bacterium]